MKLCADGPYPSHFAIACNLFLLKKKLWNELFLFMDLSAVCIVRTLMGLSPRS